MTWASRQWRRSQFGRTLSRREIEVLRAAAYGLSGAEIGRQLGISENTVRDHYKRIYARLGVTHRCMAVLKAERMGLLQGVEV